MILIFLELDLEQCLSKRDYDSSLSFLPATKFLLSLNSGASSSTQCGGGLALVLDMTPSALRLSAVLSAAAVDGGEKERIEY